MSKPGVPIVYANPAFFSTTGYPKDEVLGRNCRFLQGPGTSLADIEKLRVALREGRRINIEILNYKKDGTPFRNFLSISPVFEARKRRLRAGVAGGAATGGAAGVGAGSGAAAVPAGQSSAAAGGAGAVAAGPSSAARGTHGGAGASALEQHTGVAVPPAGGGAVRSGSATSATSAASSTASTQTQTQTTTTTTFDGMEEVDEPGPRKLAFFIGLQFEVLNDAMITGRLLRHEAMLRMLPQQVAL
jgi:PAS domain S-box-containing protein